MAAPLKITVNNPCSEDWRIMTPADKGRFCNSCQKTVIDFSALSDKELLEFFSKNTSNTCGRFNAQQLNRNIVTETPHKARFVYRFISGIALFIGLTNLAYSQENKGFSSKIIAAPAIPNPPADTASKQAPKPQKPTVIKGKVFDKETKEPLIGSTVIVKGTSTGVVVDLEGGFKLSLPDKLVKDTVQLEIRTVGYQTVLRTVITTNNPDLYLEIEMEEQLTEVGEIVVIVGFMAPVKHPFWHNLKWRIKRFFGRGY